MIQTTVSVVWLPNSDLCFSICKLYDLNKKDTLFLCLNVLTCKYFIQWLQVVDSLIQVKCFEKSLRHS